MDKTFIRAEENNCNALAQMIENQISGCEVTNLGNQVLLMFQNKSVATVFPLTAETVDIFCQSVDDKKYDMKDVSVEKCLAFLQQIAAITEETSTGDVAGYDTSKAFSAPGQKSNRAVEQSKREGWTTLKPLHEIDRLKNPFGVDPLGEKERSSISEISGSNDDSQVLEYLAEMLPADSAEIEGDELILQIDSVKIRIAQETNGNFSVQSSVAGEVVQEKDNVPTGNLIRWAFEIVSKIQDRVADRESGNDVEITNDDVWGTIKELARETGKSDDILRNKDLFDLKQGLCVSRPPFDISGRRFFGDDFINETSGSQVSSSLKGSTMHDGAPVSVNEGRDISRPYADTLGGKKLVYLESIGATFVNKSDLPKKQKLNFDPVSRQVIFTSEDVPTCRAGMWKFFGRR